MLPRLFHYGKNRGLFIAEGEQPSGPIGSPGDSNPFQGSQSIKKPNPANGGIRESLTNRRGSYAWF